jgi:alpha-1,3-rhamnosyl/mannosyltransferase
LPTASTAAGLRRLGLPPRYLLYLGTIEPRKNVLLLMRVYCQLPAKLRERWPLVLAGAWGWNVERERDYYQSLARRCGVIHLDYVADEDLPVIYNGARALLYPSHYEGFGLPPVEMLSCGGAVLASTTPAVAETVGGQAALVDPQDPDAWRAALIRILTDDDWLRSLRAGAEAAAATYSWERCARETRAVYDKALGRPASGQTDPIPGRHAA